MPKHPSDGTLRRLLDEPVAVAVVDEDHVAHCLRCQAHMAVMRDDDAAVSAALGGQVDVAPAAVALERLRTAERSGAAVAVPLAGSRRGREAQAVRRRRRFVRPATVITSALVLMGGATAAAATHLVTIFEPGSVTPVVIQAGDISSLQALSQFGDVSGTRTLDLTPENSASALASAVGFALPTVTVSSDLAAGAPSYWLVSADQAQLEISVAKAEQAAAKGGVSVPSAPPGVDGSIIRVATGAGVLEVWGLSLPGGAGTGRGPLSLEVGSSSAKAGPSGAANGAAGPGSSGGPAVSDLPQLAVAEVPGPMVSSSGAGLSSLESYLLSQPEISPSLAAQIRAIGDPSSTLPIPVPAGANTSTVELNGHAAVLFTAANEGTIVVWAESGRLFAVLGQASASDLLDVARQIA